MRNVLQSLSQHLKACRVDVQVDNMPLIAAWNNEGSRSSQLNSGLKDIFQLTLDTDLVLNLIYVPSACNVADEPSRSIRKSDAMLSERSWGKQRFFGGRLGHTFDLMALDSNSMKDRSGNHLPHFTPFPTPKTSGVNVFAQTLHQAENYHVFPPFNLTLPPSHQSCH